MRSLLHVPPHHRTLLKAFIVHQVFGRYAGSTGGLLWTIAHPLAQVLVYSFLFQFIFRVRIDAHAEGTSSFTLFFLTGFFPWLLFSNAVDQGCRSVLDHGALVSKVAFPSELLPVATTLSAFVLNGVGFGLLVFYLGLQRTFAVSWCLLPFVVLLQLLFCCGLAFFLSVMTVFFRDMHEIVRIVLTIWFYATPVLYPASYVPEPFQWLVFINPMAHFVGVYRKLLFFHCLPFTEVFALTALALVVYTAGMLFFRRAKRAFGDVL